MPDGAAAARARGIAEMSDDDLNWLRSHGRDRTFGTTAKEDEANEELMARLLASRTLTGGGAGTEPESRRASPFAAPDFDETFIKAAEMAQRHFERAFVNSLQAIGVQRALELMVREVGLQTVRNVVNERRSGALVALPAHQFVFALFQTIQDAGDHRYSNIKEVCGLIGASGGIRSLKDRTMTAGEKSAAEASVTEPERIRKLYYHARDVLSSNPRALGEAKEIAHLYTEHRAWAEQQLPTWVKQLLGRQWRAMPSREAVLNWLYANTTLTLEQMADFTGFPPADVKGVADDRLYRNVEPIDPISIGLLTREQIERCEQDRSLRLMPPPWVLTEFPTS